MYASALKESIFWLTFDQPGVAVASVSHWYFQSSWAHCLSSYLRLPISICSSHHYNHICMMHEYLRLCVEPILMADDAVSIYESQSCVQVANLLSKNAKPVQILSTSAMNGTGIDGLQAALQSVVAQMSCNASWIQVEVLCRIVAWNCRKIGPCKRNLQIAILEMIVNSCQTVTALSAYW